MVIASVACFVVGRCKVRDFGSFGVWPVKAVSVWRFSVGDRRFSVLHLRSSERGNISVLLLFSSSVLCPVGRVA